MEIVRYLAVLVSCLFLLSSARPACAQTSPASLNTLEGLVVGVSEGDHITVNSFGTEINVRLYGIAVPQTTKLDQLTGWYKAGQPYAEDAFRALSIKILHEQVKVEIRRTIVLKNDLKPIALAVIYLGNRNINLEMVSDGWAWTDKRLVYKADIPAYLSAEKHARAKKNGLWFQENPEPPWEFRSQRKIKNKHS